MTQRKLTALVPAHNDDYALDFCLHSIVDHFDEIIVLDDCSTDHTADIASDVASHNKHVRLVCQKPTAGLAGLGWIEARNRLLAETDSDWLFWLDADDVLCEYNAHLLKQIAEGSAKPTMDHADEIFRLNHARQPSGQALTPTGPLGAPLVRLQLCEMWGDFNHTTQRLRHYDRCHVFWNRRLLKDLSWYGGRTAKYGRGVLVKPAPGPGPLLFHIKGVKPDRRLVERQFTRKWLGAPSLSRGRPEDFAGLEKMSDNEVHLRAIHMLFHSKQDRIRATYHNSKLNPRAPRRPKVITDAPRRFLVMYRNGEPIDRIERPWVPLSSTLRLRPEGSEACPESRRGVEGTPISWRSSDG